MKLNLFKKIIESENKSEILKNTEYILEYASEINLENTDAYKSIKYHYFLLSDKIITDSDIKLIKIFKTELIRDAIGINSYIEYYSEFKSDEISWHEFLKNIEVIL